jgi:peptide deformylase
MIKPITIYGNPVLREECVSIEKTYPGIREVIETMWQTLRNADGCGLAAPQINLPIKLFVVNSRDSYAYMSARERECFFAKDDCGIEETFINAEITACSDEVWLFFYGLFIFQAIVCRPT